MPKRRLPAGSVANQVILEPEVAVAAIAIYSALSDGESFSDVEGVALDEALAELDLYQDYEAEDFQELGAEVGELMSEVGAGATVELAIAALTDDDELQEIAYITAVWMIAVDGAVPDAELDYIEDLRLALNISEERAEELITELLGEEDYSEEA